MSRYTTELRFICENASGLDLSEGYNSVDEIISKAREKIFNFDYPIFDESYRGVIETKFLKHYYTREISEETVGLWKLRLNTKFNELMPYYNKLYESEKLKFDALTTFNVTKNSKNENKSDNKLTEESTIKSNGTAKGVVKATNEGRDLYSDTPQGALTNVENETYLTNARKVIDNDKTDSESSNTSNTSNNRNSANVFTSVDTYLENVSGYSGASPADLLLKYRETFLNIDLMVIEAMSDLFFNLW